MVASCTVAWLHPALLPVARCILGRTRRSGRCEKCANDPNAGKAKEEVKKEEPPPPVKKDEPPPKPKARLRCAWALQCSLAAWDPLACVFVFVCLCQEEEEEEDHSKDPTCFGCHKLFGPSDPKHMKKIQAQQPCRAGYHAAWDTTRRGIPRGVGCHAVRATTLLGIPCRVDASCCCRKPSSAWERFSRHQRQRA